MIYDFKLIKYGTSACTGSQCSTVVRNIVVRATIKINGKP